MAAVCAACGATELKKHLQVGGDAGGDGLIPTTDRFGTALADVVRCSACGHMQVEPMPSQQALESAYEEAASDDYVEEEAGQRETARRILDRVSPYVSGESVRLLDLGCWI